MLACSIGLTLEMEKSKTAKNGPTPLGSGADCSATNGRSDMRQTPFDRGEIGLAYSMSFIAKLEPRAMLCPLPYRNGSFSGIFQD